MITIRLHYRQGKEREYIQDMLILLRILRNLCLTRLETSEAKARCWEGVGEWGCFLTRMPLWGFVGLCSVTFFWGRNGAYKGQEWGKSHDLCVLKVPMEQLFWTGWVMWLKENLILLCCDCILKTEKMSNG